MAKKSLKNAVLDNDGIEVGSEVQSNNTVVKSFKLCRKTNWPTEIVNGEEKPVELVFTVVIDMAGVKYQDILDDAIRTKIILLQNALRGSGKSPTSFEALKALSEGGDIHRHYDTCGTAPEDPEKAFASTMSDIANMSPEMKQRLMAELAKG